jgi:membrane-associated protein
MLESFQTLFLEHDLRSFVEQIGYIGVYAIVFAESGLLIGFFLPGDSLIFTAGFLSSPVIGLFDVWRLLIGAWIAAIIGDNVGYYFGAKVGPRLFRRENSLLFHKDHLVKAQEFYEKHGGKAIVFARFMPIVRTFAPIVAGIGHMDRKRFMFFNFLGGTIWIFGLGFLGFFLGSLVKDVDRYLLPIIGIIILASVLPPLLHVYKQENMSLREKIIEKAKVAYYYIKSFRQEKEESVDETG